MKTRMLKCLFLLFTPLFMGFCPIVLAADNANPTAYVSLNKYYSAVPKNLDGSLPEYYSFTIETDKMRGYIGQFRAFVPPGSVLLDLNIMESGRQKAVARHMFPPTGSPTENPPPGNTPGSYFTLDQLIAHDCWVIENTTYDVLYIASDGFTPPLELSKAGWLYVKVGGGSYSEIYDNHFSVRVKSDVYNAWWNTYIQNEANWNLLVEGVATYIDPTKTQPILTVTPSPDQSVPNTSGTVNFAVSNTGTGTMSWNAIVNTAGSWLKITSGSGVNTGSIVCAYDANIDPAARTESITVTAIGATNSPVTVTVTQAGAGGRIVSIIPDTGLTKCYNSIGVEIDCPVEGSEFYGQDGSFKTNPMSYTKLDANGVVVNDPTKSWAMIRDNVTGLIWEAKTKKDTIQNYNDLHDADNTYAWLDTASTANTAYADINLYRKDTKYFIDELNNKKFGGFVDWRLPTISELITLTSYNNIPELISDLKPAINETYFPLTQLGSYWTSSKYNYNNEKTDAWALNFKYGNADYINKNESLYVRAVRGPSTSLNAIDRFQDNKDGTVTDKVYGLMWEQKPIQRFSNWQDALSYCNSLSLANHADWRLPSVKELQSLVDYSRTTPPAFYSIFSSDSPYYYWTATTVTAYIDYLSYAWFLDFTDGAPFPYQKDGVENYVRAVREIPVISVSPTSNVVWYTARSYTFNVYISGRNPVTWSANIVEGNGWLLVKTDPGADKKTGTATCEFMQNNTSDSRTATIQIVGAGADNSPVNLLLTQESVCTAIESNGMIQLHYLVHNDSILNKKTYYWGKFIDIGNWYYKLLGAGEINIPPVSCAEPATLTNDLSINIPHIIMGEKNCKMKLVYQPDMSKDEMIFKATDHQCQ